MASIISFVSFVSGHAAWNGVFLFRQEAPGCLGRAVHVSLPPPGRQNGRAPPRERIAVPPSRPGLRLPASDGSREKAYGFPGMKEVPPPAVKHRDPEPHLACPGRHLGRHESYASADPLDVLLAVGRRQNEVPKPKREVVGQLRAQEVDPVRHEVPHGKVEEKLVRKLADPLLAGPPPVVLFHERSRLSRPVRGG